MIYDTSKNMPYEWKLELNDRNSKARHNAAMEEKKKKREKARRVKRKREEKKLKELIEFQNECTALMGDELFMECEWEDDRYSVSNWGRVLNNTTGKLVKGTIERGKRRIRFKSGKSAFIRDLVAVYHLDMVESEEKAKHINGNRLDDRACNIKLVEIP